MGGSESASRSHVTSPGATSTAGTLTLTPSSPGTSTAWSSGPSVAQDPWPRALRARSGGGGGGIGWVVALVDRFEKPLEPETAAAPGRPAAPAPAPEDEGGLSPGQ